jgi:hypothetical protein
MWDEGKRMALTKSLNNNNKYMVHIAPLVHRPQTDRNQTIAVPKLLQHTSTWFIQPPLEIAKGIANFYIKT